MCYTPPYATGSFSQRPLPSLWEPFKRTRTGNPHPQLAGPKPSLFQEWKGGVGEGGVMVQGGEEDGERGESS